ncbi:FAD-dependent monooxygenase [Kordia sp.]|uniref:FAD-dependent monooxygenase n=1 Tax=Kordia sp. TaxID=1965332 RepID=UPI003B5A0E0F
MKKVDIIGAGIGGLTTALALEKQGIEVTIYEQAESIKPLGAGIMLASNAMNVYRALQIDNELTQNAMPLNIMHITDKNLKVISKIDLQYFKDTYGLQSISIHRGKLQEILLKNLTTTKIHLNHKVQNLIKEKDGYLINFTNNTSVKSSLLLGADGIHSKVRHSLFPNSHIRTTNQVCWRGVTYFNLPKQYEHNLYEAWGNGDRFAFVQFSKDQIYWYAVKSRTKDAQEFSTAQLSNYFKDYAPIAKEIIASTPIKSIHTTIMNDLQPMPTWHDEFACLIGDAAHATTPNMGQGACQSIEDALVIAKCLKQYDQETAFKEYQKLRMPYAHKVVKQSRQIGKISHWKNPLAKFLRNSLLQIAPEKLNRMQIENLFKLQKTLS